MFVTVIRGYFRELERQRRGARTTRLRRPRKHCSSTAPSASTASRPASVTIASRPSVGRDGRRYTTDLGQAKSDISEIPNQVSAVRAAGACLNPRSAVKYAYGKDGTPILIKEPKLMLNDNDAGKPEGIHLMIGRRPNASFGNSTGDQQMSEYTGAGGGARLAMLVLHDGATREYAYGPAQGLP